MEINLRRAEGRRDQYIMLVERNDWRWYSTTPQCGAIWYTGPVGGDRSLASNYTFPWQPNIATWIHMNKGNVVFLDSHVESHDKDSPKLFNDLTDTHWRF